MLHIRKPKDEMATFKLTPRQDMEDDGIIQNQTKSKEMIKQELTSHLQNFQETFNDAELRNWKDKYESLSYSLTSI